jgi:hypothetical protein
MIGLEEATVTTTDKVVKATADAAQIGGKIFVKKDDGTYVADASLETSTSKALVVLLDENRKIAGLSKVDQYGKYSIVDGDGGGSNKIVGGSYTLVFRMNGAETAVVPVTIKANETVTKNIDTQEGGTGVIKAYVQDTDKNALKISGTSAVYDDYYVLPDATSFVSGVKNSAIELADEAKGTYNLGLYTASLSGKIIEFTGLSAGHYSVIMSVWNYGKAVGYNWLADPDTAYSFKTESVTIQNNGDKVYPEWTYEMLTAGGNEKVTVTVNFDALTQYDTYAIVVKDSDGKVVLTSVKADNSGGATSDTVQVDTNAKYTFELYTMTGNQVGTSSVNVQRVDTSTTIATLPSNQD